MTVVLEDCKAFWWSKWNTICIRNKKLSKTQWSIHYGRLTVPMVVGVLELVMHRQLGFRRDFKEPELQALQVLCWTYLVVFAPHPWTYERWRAPCKGLTSESVWIQQVLIPAPKVMTLRCLSTILNDAPRPVRAFYLGAVLRISKDTLLSLWSTRKRFPTNSVKQIHHQSCW